MLRYVLKRESTEGTVGYLLARPEGQMGPPQALGYIKEHVNDEFMRKFVLTMLIGMDAEEFSGLVQRALQQDPPPFHALLYEACLMKDNFHQFLELFEEDQDEPGELGEYSPLVHIRASVLEDASVHRRWIRLLRSNMLEHKVFPTFIAKDIPTPCEPADLSAAHSIDEFITGKADPVELPTTEEVFRNAFDLLTAGEVFADQEERHEATLCPVALQRKWNMEVTLENGDLSYGMHGEQTSYGKGLDLASSRASLYMEIAERVASFASIGKAGVLGRTRDYPLLCKSYDEFKFRDMNALDPNTLRLETAYLDQPLWWMEGAQADGTPCHVPVQLVFLFCNLDEPKLFTNLDSTGLASGVTPEQAKVSALCEVLERDAEALALYDPQARFRIKADGELGELLAGLESRGIEVVFQDITTEFGIPCYKAYVTAADGSVFSGTACKLSGPAALASALLEVPYPLHGPATQPAALASENMPVRDLSELPDYSTGNPEADLKLLEQTLQANNYTPVYVDLTRKGMIIPVMKAFIPGLELATDFSRYRRVTPRLYERVLRFMK